MHPIYEAIEQAVRQKRSSLALSHNQSSLQDDSREGLLMPQQRRNLGSFWRRKHARMAVRFLYRALLTASITVIGYIVPHFSLISGLNGAICYWPIQVRQLPQRHAVLAHHACSHCCSEDPNEILVDALATTLDIVWSSSLDWGLLSSRHHLH